jgi:iron complex transport system substrate-binding protein
MFFRRCASALALALALILSACGATAAPPTRAPAIVPSAVPVVESTAVPTAAPTAAPTVAPTAAPTAPAALTITDVAGRTVTIAATPQRIISLAPSNTEILFALDLGPKVVAVDDFSDFPAAAKDLPKIGGSNATYNFEQIVALKPDLVLAAGITPPEGIKQLEDLKLTVVVLGTSQTTFDSIFADIGLAGEITGQAERAKQVVGAMKTKFDAIKAKVAEAKTRPLVYWELDGTDPAKPFSVGPGNFVGDLIALAGGTNIFEKTSSPFPQVSAEQVVSANPEVIVLADAAYGVTVQSVAQRPGWRAIAAVQQQRIAPIDDNLVSRPGPRVVEGLEAAVKIIHPELYE